MKYLLALLLLTACRGTDLAPDEFRLDLGRGHTDMDSHTTTTPGWWDPSRQFDSAGDSSSTYIGIGWTWHIGDVAEREERRVTEARWEALWREAAYKAPPAAVEPAKPVAPQPGPPTPPKAEEPLAVPWKETATGLVLAITAWFQRKRIAKWVKRAPAPPKA